MKTIQKLFVTAGGVGYLPLAPGTWGSIVGALFVLLVSVFCDLDFTSSYVFISIIAAVFFLGVFASKVLEEEWGEDSQKIVIDEVIGVWIAMVYIPYNWYYLLLALILFRVFDIWKPLLIRKMEYAGKGWGVMLDDALAGVYANVVLNIIIIIIDFYEIF